MKPYVQIGFMPKALSIKPEPYQHDVDARRPRTTRSTPAGPIRRRTTRSGASWSTSGRSTASRSTARPRSRRWYWEIWNEPNIGYWRGTPEEFRKLHDYAIDGVRRALPTARVGGPDTAGRGGQFTRDFFEHQLRGTNYATGKIGTPLDFVVVPRQGPPDVRRRPRADGHRRTSCATIDDGFAIIASFPELKHEADRHRRVRPRRLRRLPGPAARLPQPHDVFELHGRGFARKHDLAERHGVNLEGALTWAFEFEDQPYFAGFRVLATNGIDLPVFNVFRMFSQDGRRAGCRRRATAPSTSTR